MGWSTRELAELAGTTVNTVRHYHRLGLLAEPERRHNGYKEYEVRHLVDLLRIRRLADLGVPLASVSQLAGEEDGSAEALRQLDAELQASIERLQRARADIAAILQDGAPLDSPRGFESVASRLSEADRSIIHVYTRLYDAAAMEDLQQMVAADTDAVGEEVNALPADADEAARQQLAEKLAPTLARSLAQYPWLSEPGAHLSRSEQVTGQTVVEALVELYNPAQLDVLHRASLLAQEQLRPPVASPDHPD